MVYRGTPIDFVKYELEINSDHTIVDWNHLCRDVAELCGHVVLWYVNDKPIKWLHGFWVW